MSPKDNAPLSRTDTESVLREALNRLVLYSTLMQEGWATADPDARGRRWADLKRATNEGHKALTSVPDPKPGQCATTWFDQLDSLYDRCGLPLGHDGGHKAEYAVRAAALRALHPPCARCGHPTIDASGWESPPVLCMNPECPTNIWPDPDPIQVEEQIEAMREDADEAAEYAPDGP